MAQRRWRVRLSETAERDFVTIVEWTAEEFGRRQAAVYRGTLIAAIKALFESPYLPDSQPRDEIRPGLRALHVRRRGRRGRHFVVYRVDEVGTIDIVRILHDSMDLGRHVPDDLSGAEFHSI